MKLERITTKLETSVAKLKYLRKDVLCFTCRREVKKGVAYERDNGDYATDKGQTAL